MYRARLKRGLDESVLAYVSSTDSDEAIVLHDIRGSMAHTVMLHTRRIIERKHASRILDALSRIKPNAISSGAEDIHEEIERLVVARAGAEAGGRMHTARSRNDQVALDIRLKLRDDISLMCELLLDLVNTMLTTARAHTRSIMPLYTHLQHAQYGTFSHYMISHVDALLRDFERLTSAYSRMNQCPLGAGAVGGTSLHIDRKQVAGLLGFDSVLENSIDATSARDHVSEYVAAVSIMMTNLSRMAEDFVIWSTDEFAFIELDDSAASPSSVMPQKKNPDVLEITRGKAADSIGCLVSALATTKGLATGYGRDLQNSKVPAWSASNTGIGALAAIRVVVSGMRIDTKRMAKATGFGHLDALEIAEVLVSTHGIAFRDAHGIVGRLVRDAHASKSSISKLDDSNLRRAIQRSGISVAQLRRAIAQGAPRKALRSRVSRGSSGFAEQKRMITSRERVTKWHAIRLARRKSTVTKAYAKLDASVKRIRARR